MKRIVLSAALIFVLLFVVSCSNNGDYAQSGSETASSAVALNEQSSSQPEKEPDFESSSISVSETEENSSVGSLQTTVQGNGIVSSDTSSKPNQAVSPNSMPKPKPKPTPSLEELKTANRVKICEIIETVAKEDMTDIEKAKAAYLWLFPNFKYRAVYVDLSNGYTEQLTHELASYYFKYHKGSCEHYAAVQKLIFEHLGFETLYVQGTRYSSLSKKWGEHTWNLVNVEGNWYHADGLFGGIFTGDAQTTFCVPDSVLELTHRWDKEKYPICSQPQILN